MRGFGAHVSLAWRLHLRNRMALVYGYVFPLMFLGVFWVLYRDEAVPLRRHLGELLTVTILGGACFGLPTTLVSEREQGVWRRFRLTPVPLSRLLASTVVARFGIVVSAGLLQLAAAFALGLTRPEHPLALALAFAVAALAFIGLGLLLAMLADTVPAVQALGQCVFLPMLVIGGVAVPIESLPDWAQHLANLFPGRYAVEAMQAAEAGPDLSALPFQLLVLAVTALAARRPIHAKFADILQDRAIVGMQRDPGQDPDELVLGENGPQMRQHHDGKITLARILRDVGHGRHAKQIPHALDLVAMSPRFPARQQVAHLLDSRLQ